MAGFAVAGARRRPARAPRRPRRAGGRGGARGGGAGARWRASGLRALDPCSTRFREMPLQRRRHAARLAVTEYPNLAARVRACTACSPAARRLAARGRRAGRGRLALPRCSARACCFTYSRGALAAAAVLGCWRWRRALGRARARRTGRAARSRRWRAGVAPRSPSRGRARSSGCGSAARAPPLVRGALRAGEESADLRPGEQRTTLVRVTNSGLKTWTVERASSTSRTTGTTPERRCLTDGERTRLPRDLRPGDSAVLDAQRARAAAEGPVPAGLGHGARAHDLVQRPGRRARARSRRCRRRPIAERAAARRRPRRAPVRRARWQAGRWELWRLALGMWRERPLAGRGRRQLPLALRPARRARRSGTRASSRTTATGGRRHDGDAGAAGVCGTLACRRAACAAAARPRRRRPAPRPARPRSRVAWSRPSPPTGRGLRARLHRALPGVRLRGGQPSPLPRGGHA